MLEVIPLSSLLQAFSLCLLVIQMRRLRLPRSVAPSVAFWRWSTKRSIRRRT